jgi:hypothetical protein
MNLIYWKQNQILCTERATLLFKETLKNLSQFVFSPDPSCNILMYPSETIRALVTPCIFVKNNPCNETGLLRKEKAYLIEACDKYYVPFSTCYRMFKNPYCALCHYESLFNIPIECDGQMTIDPSLFPVFTALMAFSKQQETEESRDDMCPFGHMYDKLMVGKILSSYSRQTEERFPIMID